MLLEDSKGCIRERHVEDHTDTIHHIRTATRDKSSHRDTPSDGDTFPNRHVHNLNHIDTKTIILLLIYAYTITYTQTIIHNHQTYIDKPSDTNHQTETNYHIQTTVGDNVPHRYKPSHRQPSETKYHTETNHHMQTTVIDKASHRDIPSDTNNHTENNI